MLKKMLPVVALVIGAMGMSGCTDPIKAYEDPIQQYEQVHLESYWLRENIVVQKVIPTRVGAGQLKVAVVLRNKTDGDLELDYKYYFKDARGKVVENSSTKMYVRVPRKGMEQVEFVSMTPAEDFRVEFFRAK